MPRILLRELKDRRLSILGWIAGAVAFAAFVLSIYPVLRGNQAVQDLLQRVPRALLTTFGIDPDLYLTGAGFVEAQLYTLIGPVLLISFTLGVGAAATAGEEERGTIDLLLAHPLRRASLLLQKFAAMALLAALIVAALAVTVWIGNEPAGLGLKPRGILGANLALWLLALLFGTIAMGVGAWTGRRLFAVGAGAGVAVVAFFWASLAPLSDQLRGSERFSPFSWANDGHPALHGPTLGHAQLATAILLLLGLAVALFGRRDLRTETTRRAVHDGTIRRAPSSWLRTLFGTALWERRRGMIWWMLGLYGIAGVTMGFWPTIRKEPGIFEGLMNSIPKELFAMFGIGDPKVMLTAAGFLSARLYSSIGLILALAYGIGFGTRAFAGDERAGRLESLLGLPVRRARIVRSRFAALAVLLAALCGGLAIVLGLGDAILDLGLRVEFILAANAGLFLIGLFFGALSLALGCATGRPSVARGTAIAAALGGFLINALGTYSDWFAPLRFLSPFAWYLGESPPLTRGFHGGHLSLALGSLLLAAAAMFAVGRRDLNR